MTRLELAKAMAMAAGEISMQGFGGAMAADNKSNADFDPVTEFDRRAESYIRSQIQQHFAEDAIVGEEFADEVGQSGYEWVIDPIDGTRAYITGVPVWSVLIGVQRQGIPDIGVAYFPVLDWMYVGTPEGAQKLARGTSRALTADTQASLDDAVVTATTPHMFEADEKAAFDRLVTAAKMARYGLDALGWCLVAEGGIQVGCEASLKQVDFLPLLPILRGAGCLVSNWRGESPSASDTCLLASANQALHQSALKELACH